MTNPALSSLACLEICRYAYYTSEAQPEVGQTATGLACRGWPCTCMGRAWPRAKVQPPGYCTGPIGVALLVGELGLAPVLKEWAIADP